ncbi:MAG: hypothetical protein NTW65_06805 [Deltaproteobacteria bacterium]|nr:hypothetical protein [Deltaproteobacteria bacterium]
MKKCPKCGYERTQKDDAFVSTGECPKCGVIYEKEEAHIAKQGKRAEEERLQQLRSQVNNLWQRVDSGQEAYIYDIAYIPVDSIIDKEQFVPSFDITILKKMGLNGWDIISVVPRTTGMGGNVIGVHVILKKSINPKIKDSLKQELVSYIESLDK